MTAVSIPQTATHAETIPAINADEAHRLLTEAFERLLRLLDSLHADDWSQPTACTA